MFWRKRKHPRTEYDKEFVIKDDGSIDDVTAIKNTDSENTAEKQKEPIRVIIDGILYDSSKVYLQYEIKSAFLDLPDYPRGLFCCCGIPAYLCEGFHGHWFVLFMNTIYPVSDEYVMDVIGKEDVDTYIKYFGQPQNA